MGVYGTSKLPKFKKKMTSNMIYIVALGVGFKCPRKIHLNTQCPMASRLRRPCGREDYKGFIVSFSSRVPSLPVHIFLMFVRATMLFSQKN